MIEKRCIHCGSQNLFDDNGVVACANCGQDAMPATGGYIIFEGLNSMTLSSSRTTDILDTIRHALITQLEKIDRKE